jgi:hypothetical protein
LALLQLGTFVGARHRPLGPAFLGADHPYRLALGVAVAEMQVFDLPQLHLALALLIPELHAGLGVFAPLNGFLEDVHVLTLDGLGF